MFKNEREGTGCWYNSIPDECRGHLTARQSLHRFVVYHYIPMQTPPDNCIWIFIPAVPWSAAFVSPGARRSACLAQNWRHPRHNNGFKGQGTHVAIDIVILYLSDCAGGYFSTLEIDKGNYNSSDGSVSVFENVVGNWQLLMQRWCHNLQVR